MKILLDEHLPPEFVNVVAHLDSGIPVVSIHHWRDGAFKRRDDALILRAAFEEKLTLFTFDLATIPTILQDFATEGVDHAGVLFVSTKRTAQNAYGLLASCLVDYWRREGDKDWTNRMAYLPVRTGKA